MTTIEELRHNKFQQVDIPCNGDLYQRYGYATKLAQSSYSGDEFLDPSQGKLETAAAVQKEAVRMESEAAAQKDPE